MSATVIELLAAGHIPAPQEYRKHRAWMCPGDPLTIGREVVAEIQLSIFGDQCIPRLVAKGRPTRRPVLPWRGRSIITLERGQWNYLNGYDLMVRPLAMRRDVHGRPRRMLVEFAAMSAAAASGWPA